MDKRTYELIYVLKPDAAESEVADMHKLVAEIVEISGSRSIDKSQIDLLVARFSLKTGARPETVLDVLLDYVRSNRWPITHIGASRERA